MNSWCSQCVMLLYLGTIQPQVFHWQPQSAPKLCPQASRIPCHHNRLRARVQPALRSGQHVVRLHALDAGTVPAGGARGCDPSARARTERSPPHSSTGAVSLSQGRPEQNAGAADGNRVPAERQGAGQEQRQGQEQMQGPSIGYLNR